MNTRTRITQFVIAHMLAMNHKIFAPRAIRINPFMGMRGQSQ